MSQKIIFFIVLCIAIFWSYSATAKINEKTQHEIQKIIDQNRISHQIPGVQVSIILPGEKDPVDFVSGTTTLKSQIPVTTENLFQIGSETKVYTAALLLLLEAEGKLSLDDNISKWIPNLPLLWQKISIKEILNQSSRLYNYTDSEEFVKKLKESNFKKNWTSEELIQLVVNQPRCEKWCYSNTNYILAGMIIEAVTHDSVENAMTNYLFKPLQLTNTFYSPHVNDDLFYRMAHGYSKKQTFPDEPKDVTDLNLTWGKTAGAIISTSHDTALWLRKLFNGELLPKKQQAELMTTVPADEGANYGLGIEQDFESFQQETWEHNGGTLGYSSWMVWLKESDIIITIVISDATEKREDINSLLIDLVNVLVPTKHKENKVLNNTF